MALLGASSSIRQLVSRSGLSEVPSPLMILVFQAAPEPGAPLVSVRNLMVKEAAAPRVTLQNLSQKQK